MTYCNNALSHCGHDVWDIMGNVQHNIESLLQSVRKFELKYHRPPHAVSLLLASKSQPVSKIEAALAAGQNRFGENYLQEALQKIFALADKNIEWHFIGAIQSNKTRAISENFHWVQSVSDFKIAKRLNDQRPAYLPPLNICVQVNVSHEQSKSGTSAEFAADLIKECLTLQRLCVRGIMAIPAPKNIFDEQRAELKRMRVLFEKLRESFPFLDTLSMGMSDDMEAAIAEGSSMIRIGTKIFGRR